MQTVLGFRESLNIKIQDGKAWCHANTAGGGWSNGGGDITVNDGNWHDLAMTYDGATLRFYVDGAFDNEFDRTGDLTSSGDTWFGCRSGGNEPVVGQLSGLVILDRTLTDAEVASLSI